MPLAPTLAAAHAAAVAVLRSAGSYAAPVPSALDVTAHLRRGGTPCSVAAVRTACTLAGLALADG